MRKMATPGLQGKQSASEGVKVSAQKVELQYAPKKLLTHS